MHKPRPRLVVLLAAIAMLAPAAAVLSIAPPAAAAPATTVTANFAANNGTGHAEVFGSGINVTTPMNTSKMDTLYQSGSRIIRRDAYLSDILPKGITIADYKNNVNGVANPANWDWSKYAEIDEYSSRGFKILLILSYNIDWLGWGCQYCGHHSPPRDWDVYEDVVKKIYQRFHGKLHYIEVWNEPNDVHINGTHTGFLHLTGSPYGARWDGTEAGKAVVGIEAYKDIYYHAARAIRSVNATIPIGGPAVSHVNGINWADALLNDAHYRAIPDDYINFLSYHQYADQTPHNQTLTSWKTLAANRGLGADFPIFVTEWNYSAGYVKNPNNIDHPFSISFTGNTLTDYYKRRANATMFFADNDDAAAGGDGRDVDDFFGVYANGTLTPKSRTYRLLSTDLGLGAGDSTIRGVTFAAPISQAGAATNANGEHVAWVVNDKTEPVEVTLNLTGLGAITSTQASIFEASSNQTVASPKSALPLTVSGGNASVRFTAPAQSVMGVRLAPFQLADTENLAPAATVTGSSVTAEHPLPLNAVKDGIVAVHGAGEWASNRELAPWVQLTWPTARTIGKVILYDRANPQDRIDAGRLIFSDGSEVAVPAMANDGTGKSITFPPRTVTSVRLQVTSGAGLNVGLSEFQVYRGHNIAPDATITSSTQLNTYAAGHFRAADGIAGQSTGEWVSTQTNPWIRLAWINNRTVSEVILRDRVGAANANGGTLLFSDGTSIAVTGIPADGSPKVVTFPPKRVTSLRFEVTGGSGTNVGLSEIQVYQAANLASSATPTASSTTPADPALTPAAATDGTINQWYAGEWASAGQLTPWLQLTWPTAQALGHVVLYDRNNLVDRVDGGTLRFSDGSTVAVSALDNTGIGRVVSFPARSVTWVRFEVTSGAGANVGLSEMEAFPPAQSGIAWNMASLGQVYDPAGQMYAYAPAAIDAGGTEHYWTCHNSQSGVIRDDIYHTKRTNGVITSDRSVLQHGPAGAWDSFHVCDPAVVAATVNYQGTTYQYAMFYLGNDVNASAHNQIGVAFATSLDGPWVKYPQPIVAFPGGDPNQWGAGQPSVTAVQPELGRLLLFYTVGDSTTRAYRREITLGNMASPVIGPAVQIPTAGLTGHDGAPDHLNNFDMVYDPPTDRFYVVREQHPYPVDNPNYIGASVQVASIPGDSIWTGSGTWRVEGVVSPSLTGLARNHNAGFMRTLYGTLPATGTVSVIFTESCSGACDSLWSYDLWRITGTVNPG